MHCFTCAALKVSMQHLPPPPPLWSPMWSIKTIFLMFVLFTPVLNHPWMSTLWRTGKPVTEPDCMPPPPPAKATLMCALCPLHPAWHSKSLWEHRRALLIRFHRRIIRMSFFLLLLFLLIGHLSKACWRLAASTCDTCRPKARRKQSEEMGLASFPKTGTCGV